MSSSSAAVFASRLRVETHVRRRVLADGRVDVVGGETVRGLAVTDQRVRGVHLADATGRQRTLAADVVVERSGSGHAGAELAGRPRLVGGAMTLIGADRWMISLFVVGSGLLPAELPEFLAFARELAIPDIHDAARIGEPVDALTCRCRPA